jgi:hypothetical protein
MNNLDVLGLTRMTTKQLRESGTKEPSLSRRRMM